MPRRARSIQGGYVYHVLNRSNARATLFLKEEDVERNPLRTKLVERAQDWRWSSLGRYTRGDDKARQLLTPGRSLDRGTGFRG